MKKCSACNGRGRWQERERLADGTEKIIWFECNTCHGSGVEQDAEDGTDYDIGGDSYADDE